MDHNPISETLPGIKINAFKKSTVLPMDISANIPAGTCNVIREDPKRPGILYVGTDNGVFVSKNDGESWSVLGDLPSTYVHDLIVHPRDNIIVIATHGRGMWALDANPINGGQGRFRFR